MNRNETTPRWMDRSLIALLAVSLTLNAAMAWKLHQGTLAAASRARAKAEEGLLAKGAALPSIEATGPDGKMARIDVAGAAGSGTLVYVFASRCGWCERNQANFEALAKAVENRYRVVALALDEGEILKTTAYRSPSGATIDAYRLGATPGMIAIAPDGRVDRHWLGAWSGRTGEEVEAYFGVKLPGVETTTAAD